MRAGRRSENMRLRRAYVEKRYIDKFKIWERKNIKQTSIKILGSIEKYWADLMMFLFGALAATSANF